jgi:hypothetical protein
MVFFVKNVNTYELAPLISESWLRPCKNEYMCMYMSIYVVGNVIV